MNLNFKILTIVIGLMWTSSAFSKPANFWSPVSTIEKLQLTGPHAFWITLSAGAPTCNGITSKSYNMSVGMSNVPDGTIELLFPVLSQVQADGRNVRLWYDKDSGVCYVQYIEIY